MPLVSTTPRRPMLAALGLVGLIVAVAAVGVVGRVWPGSGHATPSGIAAGGSGATPYASATSAASQTGDPGCPGNGPGDVVTIRWFVGLGAGTQPNQIDAEKHFVACFNANPAAHEFIQLDVVPAANAYDVLKTEIAAGNAPDIIGPVSVGERNGFEGLLLDQRAEITRTQFDMSQFDPGLVSLLHDPDQGQIGIPYDIDPGFIFYNKDLFRQAGLPALPTKVGEAYQGQTWDWNELATIAAQLTLDQNGNKATDVGFDATNIVQFGMDFQWADGRRMASCFGSGSFVASDGMTAQIPQVWADAFNWYYAAMWTQHFAPTGDYIATSLLNKGATISSGRIAMSASWVSQINSYGSAGGAAFSGWDMGVMPSWKGQTTSPLGIDTFTILKASKNPDQAFEAMLAIMADPTLMQVYGGEPARTADQAAWFESMDAAQAAIFPGNLVTWSVLQEMEKYPANPSPEADMPDVDQSTSDVNAFFKKLQDTSGLNIPAELKKLQATLQTDWDCSCIMQF